MSFTTITEEQQSSMGVTGLPDTPALDTSDMQTKFDELGNAAIDLIQKHISEIEAAAAALSIGCSVPTGISVSDSKLQSVINEIARIAVDAGNKTHVHSNKSVLDGITAGNKSVWDKLAAIFVNVETFDAVNLVPSTVSFPSSKAVSDYIAAYNLVPKFLASIYPVGSLYIGSSSPASFLGGTWTEVNDTGISASYTVWKRTA